MKNQPQNIDPSIITDKSYEEQASYNISDANELTTYNDNQDNNYEQ